MKFRQRHLYAERITAVYSGGPTNRGEWVPAVDVYETRECFFLVAEVSGVSQEDIKVEVEGNSVTLKGVRPFARKKVALENYYRMEFSYGAFERTFTLPCVFTESDVKATLKHGVLTVKLPRPTSSRGRKVPVGNK